MDDGDDGGATLVGIVAVAGIVADDKHDESQDRILSMGDP